MPRRKKQTKAVKKLKGKGMETIFPSPPSEDVKAFNDKILSVLRAVGLETEPGAAYP